MDSNPLDPGQQPNPAPAPVPPPDASAAEVPLQQPHAPESPYSPQAYTVPSQGAPPPTYEAKKGFNWLACCGIGCGLALVLVIVGVFGFVKFFKPLIEAGIHLGTVGDEVKKNGVPDSGAEETTPEQLSADAATLDGKWVTFSGVVADDPGSEVDRVRQQQSLQDSSAYFIKPDIVVLDVKNSAPVAKQGDTIKLTGKPVLFDFENILGPIAAREIEKENKLGELKHIVFVITDEVTVVKHAEGSADEGQVEVK